MRTYAPIPPTFWRGVMGQRLKRLGQTHRIAALYLLTGPDSNLIGLYSMPLWLLAGELGIEPTAAREVLRDLEGAEFCRYDETSETVFVVELAAQQTAETLSTKDNRWKSVVKELDLHRGTTLHAAFLARYGKAYHLPEGSPSEAPSEPLRSQNQKQNQKQNHPPSPTPPPAEGGEAPKGGKDEGAKPVEARQGWKTPTELGESIAELLRKVPSKQFRSTFDPGTLVRFGELAEGVGISWSHKHRQDVHLGHWRIFADWIARGDASGETGGKGGFAWMTRRKPDLAYLCEDGKLARHFDEAMEWFKAARAATKVTPRVATEETPTVEEAPALTPEEIKARMKQASARLRGETPAVPS